MTFETTRYSGSNRKGKLQGYLTIKGERKRVTLNVLQSPIVNFMEEDRFGITLTGEINRRDFDVGRSPNTVVSHKLKIKVILQFVIG